MYGREEVTARTHIATIYIYLRNPAFKGSFVLYTFSSSSIIVTIMAKNTFAAIMSLQLIAMATVIVYVTASEEEHHKSSCPSEEEHHKSSSKHTKSPSSSPSPEYGKSKTTLHIDFSPEEVENLSDNQLKELAASLMSSENNIPIAFHNHPKHKCWQKCAFEKVRPYCEKLYIPSSVQGCLLAGGKACALYCTGSLY